MRRPPPQILIISNEPPKRKKTMEEVRAGKVRHQQMRIDDKIALAKARLESLTTARHLLDEYDTEDVDLGEIEEELKADILAPEEEDTGGGRFKQL